MKKKDDWLPRLTQYLDKAGTTRHDSCATFAAGAVRAMTGRDLLRGIGRGTPAEQLVAVRKMEYSSMVDFLEDHMALISNPATAQIGDIAILDDAHGRPAAGVVIGASIKAVAEDRTIGLAPLEAAKKVFRI